MTEIEEVDLHAKNPREQEPTDFQHIVLLFERGEEEISHEELVKIVNDRTPKKYEGVMIHHLSGGEYKNGGLYPCLVKSSFKLESSKEFRPKKWFVETPKNEETWKNTEKETLDRMNDVLLRYKKEIKVWVSPNRLARMTNGLQIS